MLTAEVAQGPDVSGVQFQGLPVPLLCRSVIPLSQQLSRQEVEEGEEKEEEEEEEKEKEESSRRRV